MLPSGSLVGARLAQDAQSRATGAIFVGIAGTSTAVAGLALTGWAQVLVLSLVWGGAVVGVALRQLWLDAPQWAVAVPYVVVGWCSLIVAPQLVRSLGWVGFTIMLAAGIAYSAGALVYARKRPTHSRDIRFQRCSTPARSSVQASLPTSSRASPCHAIESGDDPLVAQGGQLVGTEAQLGV